MVQWIKHNIESLLVKLFNRLDKAALENRILLAQLLIQEIKRSSQPTELSDVEFKVFSQHGEDGIIQYLIHRVPIEQKVFIEFGVEDYRESNTRFLLTNNKWKGLVIDADQQKIRRLRTYDFFWKYDLTALSAFITKENINELFLSQGFHGDIGLLSIDIDGNDYWVWEAINVVQPRIVICEYNSIYGKDLAVTIPYIQNFCRSKAHYSNLYYGASLKALCLLAEQKGYVLAGVESSGTNAFFVRNDVSQNILPTAYDQCFREACAREARNPKGKLTFLPPHERRRIVETLEVYDVLQKRNVLLKDLWAHQT